MKSNVLNTIIGTPYDFEFPNLTPNEEKEILATLFEQLLLFDKITLTVGRLNFGLFFLIKHLGLNDVERLIVSGYIEFILWSPMLLVQIGNQRDDGSVDESAVYGKPPIVSGSLADADLDPERNIKAALSHFNIPSERRRIFTKKP